MEASTSIETLETEFTATDTPEQGHNFRVCMIWKKKTNFRRNQYQYRKSAANVH
jgi:hypothetical protein